MENKKIRRIRKKWKDNQLNETKQKGNESNGDGREGKGRGWKHKRMKAKYKG